MSNVIGLPCVGGKSELAPYLCEVIETECQKSNIRKYISGCGGGGKDIFTLHHCCFDELTYNEYETGLADLMEFLKEPINIIKIRQGVDALIDKAMSIDVEINKKENDKSPKKPDEIAQELKLRALFEFILSAQKDNDAISHGEKDGTRLEPLTSAIYETLLIFGSVQSNRKNIFYHAADNTHDFYKDMRIHNKYVHTLREVSERMDDVSVSNKSIIDILNANIKQDHNNIKDYIRIKDHTFLYIDPPYWDCINGYKNDFSFDEHISLIEACETFATENPTCRIMISMHEFGFSPYFLGLFGKENWHAYQTPIIPHSTRKGYLTDEMIARLCVTFKVDIGKTLVEWSKRIDRSHAIRKKFNLCKGRKFKRKSIRISKPIKHDGLIQYLLLTEYCRTNNHKIKVGEKIQKQLDVLKNTLNVKAMNNKDICEYVFCNFEIDNKRFSEIQVDDNDKICGHHDVYDDISVTNLFKNMVYGLYKEICNSIKASRADGKKKKIDVAEEIQFINEIILDSLKKDILLKDNTGRKEDIKERFYEFLGDAPEQTIIDIINEKEEYELKVRETLSYIKEIKKAFEELTENTGSQQEQNTDTQDKPEPIKQKRTVSKFTTMYKDKYDDIMAQLDSMKISKMFSNIT